MPFTCEVCGGRSDLIPAVGERLRCPHCADERPFAKRPLLVVTGTAGIGKSTLCARLAGTIPGAILLDADIHAEDLASVVPPNHDYVAFWRSMMRLAHELAQNNVAVVYFATMLPEQALANQDILDYFDSVRFLCLTCPPDVLLARLSRRVEARVARRIGQRLAGRVGNRMVEARAKVWLEFNASLAAAASETPTATVVDAGGMVDDVEHDVRDWINSHLRT